MGLSREEIEFRFNSKNGAFEDREISFNIVLVENQRIVSK